MKIAFLTPYIPFPPDTGGKIRSYHLLKQMGLRHEVHAFSVHHEDHPQGVEEIRRLCADLQLFHLSKPCSYSFRLKRLCSLVPRSVDHFHTADSLSAVRQHLQTGGYDLIFVDELVMTLYAANLPTPTRILNHHKIDYHHYWETASARPWGQEKVLDFLESLKLRRFEAQALQDSYTLCVVCSQDDERLVHQINPYIKTIVIPNGVDTALFYPQKESQNNEPILIYTGTMFYYPNVDAVLYFWREIYPYIVAQIPQVRLLIVGHNPPLSVQRLGRLPRVVVTGSVPDVRPFLRQSMAMIIPLRLGGGTRLKILEAMAMGLPVISTSVGCQGLDVKDGENILIADDPQEFAAKTVAVLSNPNLCQRLSPQGQQLAAKYDWSILVQNLLDALQTAKEARA